VAQSLSKSGGTAVITFTNGSSGATYVTEAATSLPGIWSSLVTNIVDGSGTWSATNSSATNAVEFYRARTP
jgi:hypothetical protein